MKTVVICRDGFEAALEKDQGLWLTMRSDKGQFGRFAIDPSELRATIQGQVSYQATDGSGSSVSIEAVEGVLSVRLECNGGGTTRCRLDQAAVESAIESLNIGV